MIINHGLFYNNFEGLNNDIARFRADPFVAYNEQDGMKVFTGGPHVSGLSFRRPDPGAGSGELG